jgi:hypothetical protein
LGLIVALKQEVVPLNETREWQVLYEISASNSLEDALTNA